ncbi:hypothetical protein GOB33_18845 [Sinorhizobium meliloti]|nr:hypothetical protein [Sinorhizobium meliloti]
MEVGRDGARFARDLACLLDVDDDVVAGSLLGFGAMGDGRLHGLDVMVDHQDGQGRTHNSIGESMTAHICSSHTSWR